MQLFKKIELEDLEEGTPIQFLGVYVTRWDTASWGEPSAAFVETEADPLTEAAPDMLKALQELVDAGTPLAGYSRTKLDAAYRKAEAAIEKATK